MQINSVVNLQNILRQQNFKGSFVNFSLSYNSQNYNFIPLELSKAYASPQINQDYREIETFDVSDVGQGKLYELFNKTSRSKVLSRTHYIILLSIIEF